MFHFASWYYLLLLAMVPGLWWWIRKVSGRLPGGFLYSDSELLRSAPQTLKIRAYRSLPYIQLIVVVLFIIALARPQFGTREYEIISHGVDIISAIDVSGTMAAEDFKPNNRLETAKEVFREFIHGRKSDRIGLVVFAGRSYTQVPLTLDYPVLEAFLSHVQLGMIEDGTAIGMAIATSVNRLRKSNARNRVIILLTDGDNNAGEIDPLTAARLAKSFGIKIYAVGIGKPGGAPIPFMHPLFGKRYYQNPDGSVVLTKMNEDLLIEVAALTGGRYFRATDSQKLREIYNKIDALEKTKMKVKEYDNYRELAPYILIPALLLLAGHIVSSLTWLRKIP